MMTSGQLKAAFRAYRVFWVVAAGVLLANILFYAIAVQEKVRETEALREAYMSKRKKTSVPVEADDKLRQYIGAKQALQAFRKMLPRNNRIREIENEVTALIGRNKLTADPPVFHSDGPGEMLLWCYRAELSVTGPYAGLKQFLADIQNSPRLYCIERLSLQNRSGATEQAEMVLDLSTWMRGSMKMLPLAR
ncbi:hypothetical protein DENIS_0767 [Desulfonema ishimotonii]|uniref:Pilus assembly protein PilO n=1 Tax=Desulfonema ishimotonii TaxID=45657 RepID=A0A401FS88_9BACT|nr:type 4a pilus biogenesis protein PilO [Desulfonema ishimotonii]GBC59826.1 hypothetical protein DENIS_0767 [Desulfonema ishimotonii]